ncbi:MAG: hypothetical protein QOJ39_2039 [Candidatus Eremiobacteraeota bacterium]|jgi:SAM-dependent methyltransferase|nr:hypothetical protein [Candidatus Eremiobacteraeota bacterium]
MRTSAEIRERYDGAYYTGDCGGHREYALFAGRKLEDARLAAVFALAAARPGDRVLDVGCGRGELAYGFAAAGAAVTAVDYSADAIALARATAGGLPIRFVCTDVTGFEDASGFDLAVASDVIEHLAPPELDALYQHLSTMLAPRGALVLHTWPNAWMYRYGYPRRRREATERGEQWPENPRTDYELAMHVNEQRPNVLARQLRAWFPHVHVWLGTAADPRGSLATPFTRANARDASDVFAVASHAPVDPGELLARITMNALPEQRGTVTLSEPDAPARATAGEAFAAAVTLRNDTPFALKSFFPNPVRFADRWFTPDGTAVPGTGRSLVVPAAAPGSQARYAVRAVAPEQRGRYRLRLSLVQEHVRWFDPAPDVEIEVV